ncbi:hypothetical protein [Bosea massiliensis]|uniref:DUF3551 domain-containing protein n=1 Tax=Bosea massiliensis TaxID=151419 RepID=A0ABW0PB83_9HYPH
MIRAAFLLICLTGPAHAPPTWAGWRECLTDSDCVERTALACIHGDKAACAIVIEEHREACADDPEHDDCATFRE